MSSVRRNPCVLAEPRRFGALTAGDGTDSANPAKTVSWVVSTEFQKISPTTILPLVFSGNT